MDQVALSSSVTCARPELRIQLAACQKIPARLALIRPLADQIEAILRFRSNSHGRFAASHLLLPAVCAARGRGVEPEPTPQQKRELRAADTHSGRG